MIFFCFWVHTCRLLHDSSPNHRSFVRSHPIAKLECFDLKCNCGHLPFYFLSIFFLSNIFDSFFYLKSFIICRSSVFDCASPSFSFVSPSLRRFSILFIVARVIDQIDAYRHRCLDTCSSVNLLRSFDLDFARIRSAGPPWRQSTLDPGDLSFDHHFDRPVPNQKPPNMWPFDWFVLFWLLFPSLHTWSAGSCFRFGTWFRTLFAIISFTRLSSTSFSLSLSLTRSLLLEHYQSTYSFSPEFSILYVIFLSFLPLTRSHLIKKFKNILFVHPTLCALCKAEKVIMTLDLHSFWFLPVCFFFCFSLNWTIDVF